MSESSSGKKWMSAGGGGGRGLSWQDGRKEGPSCANQGGYRSLLLTFTLLKPWSVFKDLQFSSPAPEDSLTCKAP